MYTIILATKMHIHYILAYDLNCLKAQHFKHAADVTRVKIYIYRS